MAIAIGKWNRMAKNLSSGTILTDLGFSLNVQFPEWKKEVSLKKGECYGNVFKTIIPPPWTNERRKEKARELY